MFTFKKRYQVIYCVTFTVHFCLCSFLGGKHYQEHSYRNTEKHFSASKAGSKFFFFSNSVRWQ